METFNDDSLTPDQIKMLTLQFMGQHLTGDLKALDKNMINKTNTLKGMELNPEAVLNTIGQSAPQQQGPELSTNSIQPQELQVTIPAAVIQSSIVSEIVVDKDQLEFSFETSPLSERIFESLERIEKQLLSINERLLTLEESKKFKKKD